MKTYRVVVGISGASGAIFGVRLVEILSGMSAVECHLVITPAASITIGQETDWTVDEVKAMAFQSYEIDEIGATIASGSFHVDAMVIAPCSIKSMGMLANSIDANLLIRAADVALKERRKLVLVVRETPLHSGHLRLMSLLSDIGAIIMPPVPAFYNHPETVADLIDQTVGRILDVIGVEHHLLRRWNGIGCSEHSVEIE